MKYKTGMFIVRVAATSLLGLLLASCANQPEQTLEVTAHPEPEPEPEITVVDREIPPETLYSLLVAELAGDRQRYDIALGNYAQQAHHTRDSAVAARATRIARFLGASQAALSTSLLWVEVDPTNIEARAIAANELEKVGRLTEAFAIAEPLVTSDAKSIFRTIAARAERAENQRALLLSDYDRLLALHPDDSDLLIGKGLLLHQSNQQEQALAIARQVLVADASNVSAAALESKILQSQGKVEEATARLEELLETMPTSQRLRLHYARLLADTDLVAALEQFKILDEQSPGDPDIIFSQALINRELGNLEEAVALFQELAKSPSRAPSANFYLGEIALDEGDPDLALTYFDQVTSGQDLLPALSRVADILIGYDQISELKARFNTMRERFPNQEERLYMAEAEIFSRHQMLDDAEQTLSTALTFNPDSANLRYSRAMLREQRDMIALMEEDLRAIIAADENNATALNALGYTLADRTDRYQEAYEFINRALSLRPDDPAIIDSMGWVLYRLGRYEEALARLQEAMAVFPDHEVAAHLGEVLWVTGQQEQAEAVWQEGLRLTPNSDIIPKVMERLQSIQ